MLGVACKFVESPRATWLRVKGRSVVDSLRAEWLLRVARVVDDSLRAERLLRVVRIVDDSWRAERLLRVVVESVPVERILWVRRVCPPRTTVPPWAEAIANMFSMSP